MKNSSDLNYSFEELIEFLIKFFPNLYISNENGDIIYKPHDIVIKKLEKISSPLAIAHK